MASLPYIVSGTVYDTDGTTALANIKVIIRNERTNETINQTTNGAGQYALDASNFTSQFADGDTLTVFVIYTNYEDYEEHVIEESNGGTTVNLTLTIVPASDSLRYFSVQDYFDFFGLVSGNEGVPLTNQVVLIGVQVEKEIDEECQTRWSSTNIELTVDDCNATTSWTASTDATAVTVDTSTFKTRTGSLKLGKSGTSEATFNYSKTVGTARDFRNGVVGCFVKFSSLSGLATTGNAVSVRFGSDSSNYYQKNYFKSDLLTAWNFLYFKLNDSDITTTGNPDDSACDYFQIVFTTTAVTDVFVTGTILLDNIFVVHEDHFIDEYIDTKSEFQFDYFTQHTPISRLVYFLVNTAAEENAETWVELTESGNQLDISEDTGRIKIREIDISDEENVRPRSGARQVRAVCLFGENSVPRDIRKLALLMTARDIMQAVVAKALMRGQDSFKTDHYNVLDKQIERILEGYRRYGMLNT